MSCTLINTNQLERISLNSSRGEVAEIISRELCGAENVIGKLRWLNEGKRFDAESMDDTHQLIYLMSGDRVNELESKNYDVRQGAGVYLGPVEVAAINRSGSAPTKLSHLIVPIKH